VDLRSSLKKVKKSRQLYLVFLLPLIYIIVFKYLPMYGAQIAFKEFRLSKGILESPWVGLKHFQRFMSSGMFSRVVINTFSISFYHILAGFPFPIILALAINNIDNVYYKKTVQMVTYAPHFISVVVIAGLIHQFLGPRFGLLNNFFGLFGMEPVNYLGKPQLFQSIYVWSGVWQQAGYGSIIYLAALSAIDPELHEAAIVDGATRFQRILRIDLPGILPTIVVLLIMRTGHVLEVGFEKILLLQNPMNLRTSEVIATYVYKVGLTSAAMNFSYAAAIGLFKSAIGLLLLLIVNKISKELTSNSLW
jgi:multiple sugar transport system permease protein/putative aldouronate transport system permease protein